jgi:hypothetical protein
MECYMAEVTWRQLRSWSGCKISGKGKYELKDGEKNNHMKRALWLTARIEGGGTFGAINSYDGAAMSAGLEHKIAIFPKSMKQGSLWPLLRKLELYGQCQQLQNLWSAFKKVNWYVSQDGVLRHYNTGRPIAAQEIRDELSPPGGKVPQSGPNWEKAKKWAILFHELFAAPETRQIQIDAAIETLVRGNKRFEEDAYRKTLGVEHPTVLEVGKNIDEKWDLAWCVYHSFSVNAPTMARKVLVASNPTMADWYPKKLIKELGTTKYGRWHDTKDGKNRYDRTRYFARRSGFWSDELFEGTNCVMPQDL